MFDLIKREYLKLTKTKAQELLKYNTFEDQRNLINRHTTLLKRKIEDGLFIDGEIALAKLGFDGGKTIMVNGQHQCKAELLAGIPIIVSYKEYGCKTKEDLSLLYAQFDSHRTRSLSALVKVEAHALGLNWPVKTASLLVTAAALVEGKDRAHKTDKVALLKKYTKDGAFINYIFNTSIDPTVSKAEVIKHIHRGAVVHAMLLTWAKVQEQSKIFWTQVRDGANLRMGSPIWKLRQFLTSVAIYRGRGSGYPTKYRVVTEHEVTSRCVTAWNAWRKGAKTDLKYSPDKPIPKAI